MLSIDDAPALCPEVGDDGVIELCKCQRSSTLKRLHLRRVMSPLDTIHLLRCLCIIPRVLASHRKTQRMPVCQ